ncbi:TPA: hypothetical protein ACISW6_002292, partial [Salmonella enterica subsp. enterica serovar Waycross]
YDKSISVSSQRSQIPVFRLTYKFLLPYISISYSENLSRCVSGFSCVSGEIGGLIWGHFSSIMA